MWTNLTEEAKKLSIQERITLVEEIWDSIAEDNGCFELTKAQKQELDRRLESFRATRSQGRTWEEIKRDFLNSK
jgi:putative addiction module component (TIGR02574 family)